METLGWFILWFIGLGTLAYHRVALTYATGAILAGLLVTTIFSPITLWLIVPAWLILIPVATVLNVPEYRNKFVLNPIYEFFKKSIPTMSDTEKQAIDSGTVGWDGELFSGRPDWHKMTQFPAPSLTAEEQAFINGPVKELCELATDWDICEKYRDLPPQAWEFLKNEGFFALIIPKKYGGKGFSALAHSEIICRLASRSFVLSSIASVPNSLGPAELLLMYGTEEQKNHYLPRLAKGIEIPCFALTGPEAGSDAGAIPDFGIVCKGHYEGKEVLGIRLTFEKRYITLAPIATLIGLAFKLRDPDHLLSEEENPGITCALIPSTLEGITKGRRHLPTNIPFQNGPISGKDVFVPIDAIIGGSKMAGRGWTMLVECLSVGRAISLPSTSTGGAKAAFVTTGAYSMIRRQFNTPIANFEGIQESLARLGAFTYICESARLFTPNYIDHGEKPAVPGAITKYHVTEFGQMIAKEAMDIHAGKGVMQGPNNYLARGYQSTPVAITVEGANILTRSMIIFGQGGIRCHPYILNEMLAAQDENFDKFSELLGQHTSHILSNSARSLFHGLTFSTFAATPTKTDEANCYRQLSRASSAFALMADACMILLGGKLKFKESLSGRLGDCLSMLYLSSAVLKYYADQGRNEEDLPFVQWSIAWCLNKFWLSMDSILSNFPNKLISFGLRAIVMPLGRPTKPPKDKLNREISKLMTHESSLMIRFASEIFISEDKEDQIRIVHEAFRETLGVAPIRKKVLDALRNKTIRSGNYQQNIKDCVEANIITDEEANQLSHAEELCTKVIAVDDFDPDDLKKGILNHSRKSTFEANAVSLKRVRDKL